MTAKEMFKNLGWEELPNKNYPNLIMYKRLTPQHLQRITFNKETKQVTCACLDDTYVKKGFRMKNTPMQVDLKHLQAINKQVEELWGKINES